MPRLPPTRLQPSLRSKESVTSSSAPAKRMSLASGKVGTECGPFLNGALSRSPRRTTHSWLHALGPVVLTGWTPVSATKHPLYLQFLPGANHCRPVIRCHPATAPSQDGGRKGAHACKEVGGRNSPALLKRAFARSPQFKRADGGPEPDGHSDGSSGEVLRTKIRSSNESIGC